MVENVQNTWDNTVLILTTCNRNKMPIFYFTSRRTFIFELRIYEYNIGGNAVLISLD